MFTFEVGTVPTVHMSFHNGDHYNSVRRLDDPGTGPAKPIGHELTIQEVPSLEEQKQTTLKTNDFEKLVTQAMSVLGAPDCEIMSASLMKFSEGGKLDYNSISKYTVAIQTLYEELEVQKCGEDFKSMQISGRQEEEKTSSKPAKLSDMDKLKLLSSKNPEYLLTDTGEVLEMPEKT